MPLNQKLFALVLSAIVFLFIFELVRKRRLREEYSVLWLLTSVAMFVLVIKYEWLIWLTNLIGAALPTSTLFFGSIVFLMLVAIQVSIKLSRLADQVKNLSQDNALLRAELSRVGSSVSEPAGNQGGTHSSE